MYKIAILGCENLHKKTSEQVTLFRCGARNRNRTGTGITTHGILSPGRLPVPPLEHY